MARPKKTQAEQFIRELRKEHGEDSFPEFVGMLAQQVEDREPISPAMLSDYNQWAGEQKILRLERIKREAEAQLKEARKQIA